MTLNSWIKKKVKQGTFSRKPHPVVPFILFIMILAAWIIAYLNYDMPRYYMWIMNGLVIFTGVFSVCHWYVWFVTRKRKKKR
jgi:hypothetical protein